MVEPTRFELIVNAKTAKAQNIEIPTLILAQADQIIITLADVNVCR
jgi:putative ABC transport system substrate-binding protein